MPKRTRRKCSMSGCSGLHKARGLCAHHYQRLRKGVPLDKPNPKAMTTAERFWSKVRRGAPTECWEWTGPKHRQGYGHFYLNGGNQLAHRVAYALTSSTDPGDGTVCHSCDNTSCVNPAHLWLGDQADNVHDMLRKGRGNFSNARRGAESPFAKLNEDRVRELRRLKAGGATYDQLAEMFGVHRITVANAVKRKTWRHVE